MGISEYKLPVIDTDLFGTFSGEVERKGTPVEALHEKCNLAYALTGCSLVIASVGVFVGVFVGVLVLVEVLVGVFVGVCVFVGVFVGVVAVVS